MFVPPRRKPPQPVSRIQEVRVKLPAFRYSGNKDRGRERLVPLVGHGLAVPLVLRQFGWIQSWAARGWQKSQSRMQYAAPCLLTRSSPFTRNFARGIQRGSPEGREASQENRGHDCRRDRQAHGQYEHGRPFQSAPRRSDGGAPEHRHGLWLALCRARTHCEWSKYAEYRVRAQIGQEYLAAR